MKVGLLQLGQIEGDVLVSLKDGLTKIYPDTTVTIINETLAFPAEAYDKKRNQYNSSLILNEIRSFADKNQNLHRILAITEADIFAPSFNYVFGQANVPGKAALISLRRLKPEFYGDKPNPALYMSRAVKEAVHEIGHTLGVQHCHSPTCVMHFSNSIFDTDKKQSLLCDESYLQAALAITTLG